MTETLPAAVPATTKGAPLAITAPVTPLPGIAHGVFQPSVLVRLGLPAGAAPDLADLDQLLAQALAPRSPLALGAAGVFEHPLAQRVIQWAASLQAAAGHPVFEPGRVIGLNPVGPQATSAMLAVPYAPGRASVAAAALEWSVRCLAALLAGGEMAAQIRAGLRDSAQALIGAIGSAAPRSRNTVPTLRAAHEMQIAWSLVAEETYQYGTAAASRWMHSTFTDRTSQVSAELARNKLAAAQVLRAAGLPVPEHVRVDSEEAAEQAAERLGYPVVVKPADLDGGVEVHARLRTPQAVREAYRSARSRSAFILVEKHVQGRDYRLEAQDGELVWAIERVPGGVTGDGRSTVRELLAVLNADPRRSHAFTAMLKPVDLDDEALALLAERGLGPDAVVPAGEFVALRSIANVSAGGTPLPVLDKVHPVNRQLAEDAARALRLDIAGVDMILPDIARPWTETGGAICEINAQPMLGTNSDPKRFHYLLERMLPQKGRVPVLVVVGQQLAVQVAQRLQAMAAAMGLRCGLATPQGVWAGDRSVGPAGAPAYSAAQLLATNRDVQAIVLVVPDASVVYTGLPFDRYDALVMAQPTAQGSGPAATYGQVVAAVAPHLMRAVVVNADDEASLEVAGPLRALPMVLTSARPQSPHVQHYLGAGGNAVWLKADIGGQQVMAGTSARPIPIGPAPALVDAATAERLRAQMLAAGAALAAGWPVEAAKGLWAPLS